MKSELFYFSSCPFCQKVLRFLEEKNERIVLRNTQEDPQAKGELLARGGKTQVPALGLEDGSILYESDAIISYLAEKS